MTPRRGWLLGASLAAVAMAATAMLPSEAAQVAPFVTDVRIGDTAHARELVVTVADVQLADQIVDGASAPLGTDGVWVVVRLTAASVSEPVANWFTLTRLEIGGLTYSLSRRVRTQFTAETLQPGLPLTGFLVFEIPRSAADDDAAILLTQRTTYPQLDSMIRVPLRLGDIPRAAVLDLTRPERSAP